MSIHLYPPVTAASIPSPEGSSFQGWAFDPAHADQGVPLSGGAMYLSRIVLPRAAVISKLWVVISTAGSTLTSNQNFLALYDSTGTRRAVTADQTTAFASAAILGADVAAPYSATAGTYFVGILANGGTPPTLLSATLINKSSRSVGNAGITAADGYRFGFSGSSQTATPASITVASIDPNIGATLWAAVS